MLSILQHPFHAHSTVHSAVIHVYSILYHITYSYYYTVYIGAISNYVYMFYTYPAALLLLW